METASLFIQKVGMVLSASGTISHMIVSEARKAPCAKGRGEDIN